jgi:hypothetical protein
VWFITGGSRTRKTRPRLVRSRSWGADATDRQYFGLDGYAHTFQSMGIWQKTKNGAGV